VLVDGGGRRTGLPAAAASAAADCVQSGACLLARSLPSVDHCLLPLRRTRNQFIHVAGNLPPPGPLPLVRVTG